MLPADALVSIVEIAAGEFLSDASSIAVRNIVVAPFFKILISLLALKARNLPGVLVSLEINFNKTGLPLDVIDRLKLSGSTKLEEVVE